MGGVSLAGHQSREGLFALTVPGMCDGRPDAQDGSADEPAEVGRRRGHQRDQHGYDPGSPFLAVTRLAHGTFGGLSGRRSAAISFPIGTALLMSELVVGPGVTYTTMVVFEPVS